MMRERGGEREVVTSSNETRSCGPSGHGVLAQTCVNSRNQEMCPRKYAEGNVMAHSNTPECQRPLPFLFSYISKPLKLVVTVRCRVLDIFYVFCHSEWHSVIINVVYHDRWLEITAPSPPKKPQPFPASVGVALLKWQLFPACDDKVMLTCFILIVIYDANSSYKVKVKIHPITAHWGPEDEYR